MPVNKLRRILSEQKARKHAMLCLLVFIAVFGMWNALRFGAASLDYYYVQNTIEKWQLSGEKQQKTDYISAKESINKAEALHFTHPLYADLSGQIVEWGVVAGYAELDYLSQAKTDYLRATSLRPAWPVTWASLAMIKWRLNEFDDEMLNYIVKADELGSQKPEVHAFFAEIGLALYQANHSFYRNIRMQTQARVVLGLRNPDSRPRVEAAIERHQAKRIACIWAKQRDPFVADTILKCL
jgi:hypothetical protein